MSRIAAYFAVRHPEKVKKAAFLAPFVDTYKGEKMMNVIKQPLIGEYIIRLFGDKMITNPSNKFYSKEPQTKLVNQLRAQLEYKGKKRAVLANHGTVALLPWQLVRPGASAWILLCDFNPCQMGWDTSNP